MNQQLWSRSDGPGDMNLRRNLIAQKTKKTWHFYQVFLLKMVAGGRVELPTRGFSIRCSTN